jgi:2-haloacid dehalogenase
LSVEDAGAWKPARSAYEYAARTCGTDLAEMLLVAVHPWDIDGAARAGLSTAWIDRAGTPYPDSFTAPTLRATGITDLADQLS